MAMLTVAIHSGVELPAKEVAVVQETTEQVVVEETAANTADDGTLDFNDAETEMDQQAQ
jgi:hypothetical protein